jgi:hypothetical protein
MRHGLPPCHLLPPRELCLVRGRRQRKAARHAYASVQSDRRRLPDFDAALRLSANARSSVDDPDSRRWRAARAVCQPTPAARDHCDVARRRRRHRYRRGQRHRPRRQFRGSLAGAVGRRRLCRSDPRHGRRSQPAWLAQFVRLCRRGRRVGDGCARRRARRYFCSAPARVPLPR